MSIFVVALAAVALAALELIGKGTGDSEGSSVPGYAVVFSRGQEEIGRLTVADLRELPQAHITAAGKNQDGPLLTSALKAVGLEGVKGVTIIGMGVRDDGRLDLGAAELPSVVLDFSDRGTVKACSPDLAWADWVRDVTEIAVR